VNGEWRGRSEEERTKNKEEGYRVKNKE